MVSVLFPASRGAVALVDPVVASGDTWGISGPDFVKLYAACVAVTVLVALVARAAGDVRADRSMAAVRSIDDLTAYEVAQLANGPTLVTLVALWSLWRRGVVVAENALVDALIETHGDALTAGRIERAEHAAPDRASAATALRIGRIDADLTPLEVEVVTQIERSPGCRPAQVGQRLRRADAMVAVRTQVEARGLRRPEAVRTRMRWAVVVSFVPVLLLGVARAVAGTMNDKPIGYLLALMVAAGVGLTLLAQVPPTGRRVQWALGRAERRLQRSIGEVRASLAAERPAVDEPMAIALLGPGVLWEGNPAMAAILNAPASMAMRGRRISRAPFASTAIAGYAGTGCGGSCGGGGGGCGGGGGGGGGGCGG